MKTWMFIFALLAAAITSNAFAENLIKCKMAGLRDELEIILAKEANDLPEVPFPYPVKPTIFNVSAKNLLLIAMDKQEPTRARIFISAQKNEGKTYEGQFMTDFGGNQLQLDNGLVSCQAS